MSFNGKLRDELLNGEIFNTLLEAQVLVEQWRQEYNRVRPHGSLEQIPPAEFKADWWTTVDPKKLEKWLS